MSASLGQLGLEVAKGSRNEVTYYTAAAVLLPASLVRIISAVMPMIAKPADSRCGAAAGPGWSLLSLHSKQLPHGPNANSGDRRGFFDARSAIVAYCARFWWITEVTGLFRV
jgi:hypothetical protein